MAEKKKRDHFGSKIGIIAAAVGSAVGLGNIYRFPCMAGENGGGAFLIVYLGIVLALGLPMMVSEFMIGRRAQKNPVGAFKALAPDAKGWALIGYTGVLCGFLILAFYTTVAGWTLESVYKSVINYYHGKDLATIEQGFNDSINMIFRPLLWQAVFIFISAFVIAKGISKGIEKYSKILMPTLTVILIILCVKSLMLPGAFEGLKFFFKPDFSKIDDQVLISALGQAFFSMSLGMGALITYGSYISKKDNLVTTSLMVGLSDTFVAILAGIIIFPAAFSFGIQPEAGPSLAFNTLPMLFNQMKGGYFFCLLFFILLVIAAWTSALSLLEVIVSYMIEELKLSRRKATIYSSVGAFIISILATMSLHNGSSLTVFGLTIFDGLDKITSMVFMTLGGLFTVIFLGWKVKKQDFENEFTNGGTVNMRLRKIFYYIIKFIAPAAITVIMVSQFII